MNDTAHYGNATRELLAEVLDRGVRHATLLMRHSAREYDPDVHDLVNPLTEPGREYSRRFGDALPKHLHLRGYASPPERCVETAELVLGSHAGAGGAVTATRPVESLGVFYALDQIKMWKALRAAGGLAPFIRQWSDAAVAPDAVIPADQAARLVVSAALHRLRTARNENHVDLCVTHDMTILLVRDRLLGEAAEDYAVEYLDGLVLFEDDSGIWLQSQHGAPRNVAGLIS